MNRLILVGNGFDLAKGLKSSYQHFIDWLCKNIVNTMSSINNDPGMDVIQKYNAMRADQTYISTLARSWHQP